MSIESMIENYGYWALLIGTFFEGETIVILAGFLAHQGYLKLHWIILISFFGSLCGDQLFFFLGRKKGTAFLSRRPKWQRKINRLQKMYTNFHTTLVLGFRFMYGLRTILPFFLGMGNIQTGRFIALNIMGALIWAICFGSGGYLFGKTLSLIIDDIKKIEFEIVLAIIVVGIVMWLRVYYLKKSRTDVIEK